MDQTTNLKGGLANIPAYFYTQLCLSGLQLLTLKGHTAEVKDSTAFEPLQCGLYVLKGGYSISETHFFKYWRKPTLIEVETWHLSAVFYFELKVAKGSEKWSKNVKLFNHGLCQKHNSKMITVLL